MAVAVAAAAVGSGEAPFSRGLETRVAGAGRQHQTSWGGSLDVALEGISLEAPSGMLKDYGVHRVQRREDSLGGRVDAPVSRLCS